MEEFGIAGFILVVINFLVSYAGFRDADFYKSYNFRIDSILYLKEYKRIFTSAFLHSGWFHLFVNMISLYAFSQIIETFVGSYKFLIIYFVSLTTGNLLSLYIHRAHQDYSAVGASGAVCGVVFASIAFFPGLELGFWGMPTPIPAWAFAFVYCLFCIFGIKNQSGNIGHEAHLGGAVAGLLTAIIMEPSSLKENYLPIMATLIPCVVFFYLILSRPNILIIGNNKMDEMDLFSIDEKYNHNKTLREQELNRILEKIHTKGMDSLSKKEKEKLEKYSQEIK